MLQHIIIDEEITTYRVNNSEWNFDGKYLVLSWQGGNWNLDLADFLKYVATNKEKDIISSLKHILQQCLSEMDSA